MKYGALVLLIAIASIVAAISYQISLVGLKTQMQPVLIEFGAPS